MKTRSLLLIHGLRRNLARRIPAQRSACAPAAAADGLFERSPAAMWICDARSLRFLAVNEAARQLYGHDQQTFLGMSVHDLCGEAAAGLRAAAESTVVQHRRADGATLAVEISVRQIEFAGCSAMLAAVRDVTVQRRAISAVESSERRFRDLFEHSVGLICTHDLEGTLLAVNPAAAAALGRGVGELIGRSLKDFVGATMRPYFDAYLQRIARRGEDAGHMYVMHADGSELIWKFHNRVLRDEHGEAFVMGHAQDITASRRCEHRLREQQAELEAVTDSSPMGLFRADFSGAFTYVNRSFERIVGLRPDQAMGSGWLQALNLQDHARVVAQWDDAVARRARFQSCHRFQREGVTVWASMRAEPLIVDGEVAGYVGSIADITARQVAELQLARNEQRLRTIADALPAMIAYVDAMQRFTFVNATYAQAFGRQPSQLIGRTALEVLGAELHAKRAPYLERALQGERIMFEEESQHEGQYRCREISYIPQHDEQTQEVLGLHVMIQDITRKALAERDWMRAAEADGLTGVANRAGFLVRLDRALARSRDHRSMLALMYLDIDRFKQINDSHGHGVGDALLKAFAQRLSSILRPSDIVGRLGGDEFTVIMEAVRRPQYASVVAAKIVSAMRRPFVLEKENVTLSLSTSVGLAMWAQEPGVDAASLLKRADVALYEAKAAGRDGYRLAHESRNIEHCLALRSGSGEATTH